MRSLQVLHGTPLNISWEGGGEHESDPVPGHGPVVDALVNLPLEAHLQHPVSLEVQNIINHEQLRWN